MRTVILSIILCFFFGVTYSQINISDIKDKTTKKIEKKMDKSIDKGVDKAIDKTEEKIEGVVSKKGKSDDNNKQNPENVSNENNGDINSGRVVSGNIKPEDAPKLTSYTKYDFVPGDQVLFFEDFSLDAIGDIPAMWTTNGSAEVRTLNNYPGNWLCFSSEQNVYCLMKNLVLPENFIFEFDLVAPAATEDNPHTGMYLTFFYTDYDYLNEDLLPGDMGFHVYMNEVYWSANGYKNQEYLVESRSELAPIPMDKTTHVIIWVQKRRLRVYHQGQKVIDGPTALPEGAKYNRLRFSEWGYAENHCFITNLKVTTAAPDIRSKLLTEGKLISYGIYFDSGKDVVKAESYGALNDIAKVLKENTDVKIMIVGYTDSDGDDALNLDLSKRRAANVKNSLVKDFGIDAARIETNGKGEKEPIASNDTPENKSKNRRVEFLKK